jgi:ATP/maltotriose-dependent transcriptional regulator MalT
MTIITTTEVPYWYVGRDRELALLRGCAEDAGRGRPRVALVAGPAGIGKTSLIGRLLPELDRFVLLRASCDRTETDFAFAVVGQLLARVPQRARAAYPLLTGQIAASVSVFEVAVQLRALLADLCGGPGQERPLVIVVDDAQWADTESVRCLGSVLRRLDHDPVFTLLSARTEEAQDGDYARLLAADPAASRLQLAGLSPREVGELAERLGFSGATGPVADRLHRHTGGHPLPAHTVLSGLSQEALTDLGRPLPVPSSVRDMVLRQLAELPPDSRRLLDALAVLDARSPLAVLAEVAGVTDAAMALGPLVSKGLVQCYLSEPSVPVEPQHPMRRGAVYDAMDPRRRRELHAAAARTADEAARLTHLVAAADRADPELAAELEAAAAEVMGRDADRGVRYLLWAADLCGRRAERERLLLSTVSELLWWQKHRRAVPLYPAVEACAPSALRSCLLGQLSLVLGQPAVAESHLQDAIRLAAEGPVLARAYNHLAGLYVWQGAGSQTIEAAENALRLSRFAQRDLPATHFFLGCGELWTKGPVSAMRRLQELSGLPEVVATARPEDAHGLTWRAGWRIMSGQLTAGIADATAAIRLARQGAPVRVTEYAHLWRAHGNLLIGDWQAAAIDADNAMASALAEEKPWTYAPTNAMAAMVAAVRGEWQRAIELVAATERYVAELGPAQFVVFTALAAGTLAQAREDGAALMAAMRPVLELPERHGRHYGYHRWWLPMVAEGQIETGRFDEAGRTLAELDDRALEGAGLDVVLGWLRGRLLERTGDADAARSVYEAVLAGPVSEDDVPLHRARLEQSLGRLLMAQRNRRAAIEWLRRAHDRYASLGARPFLERCGADLVACGLHPPRPGAEALRLTGRERDVAHLIARGLTNDEAARELFVSAKTIEYHLGNIYAKLGCSRHELATMLASKS